MGLWLVNAVLKTAYIFYSFTLASLLGFAAVVSLSYLQASSHPFRCLPTFVVSQAGSGIDNKTVRVALATLFLNFAVAAHQVIISVFVEAAWHHVSSASEALDWPQICTSYPPSGWARTHLYVPRVIFEEHDFQGSWRIDGDSFGFRLRNGLRTRHFAQNDQDEIFTPCLEFHRRAMYSNESR